VYSKTKRDVSNQKGNNGFKEYIARKTSELTQIGHISSIPFCINIATHNTN
jgi:hypothetical protein